MLERFLPLRNWVSVLSLLMSLFRTYELVGLLLSGYVNSGNDMGDIDVEVARELNIPLSERSENVRPLFSDYVAAHGISKDE